MKVKQMQTASLQNVRRNIPEKNFVSLATQASLTWMVHVSTEIHNNFITVRSQMRLWENMIV